MAIKNPVFGLNYQLQYKLYDSVPSDSSDSEESDDITSTWTALGNVISVNGPKTKSASIDTSLLNSRWDSTAPGSSDPGEWTVELEYEPAITRIILGLQDDQLRIWLRGVPQDGTVTNSSDVSVVYVSEFDRYGKVAKSGRIVSSVTFKNTDGPMFTLAT